jgi:hypothetical protein
VVLLGALLGLDVLPLDVLAVSFLVARVGQSMTHIVSGEDKAINLRFGLFMTQFLCLVGMGVVTAFHAI